MIIKFKNHKIERLCHCYEDALKYFGNKKIAKSLMMLMMDLRNLNKFNYFYTSPALKHYRAHELKGDKKKIISLSLDYSFRVTCNVKLLLDEDEITILEVTNHYDE